MTQLFGRGSLSHIVGGSSEIIVVKFGGNSAISGTETVWSTGGLYTWPSTVEKVSLISDNVADTATTGAGARTVVVSGLDADFNDQSETVSMNGDVGAVDTTLTFSRVFRMYVDSAGTYSGGNVGTITGTHKISGDTLAEIIPTDSQTKLAFYTVPAGYTAYVTNVHISVSSSRDGVTVQLLQRPNADQTSAPFSPFRIVSIYTDILQPIDFSYYTGIVFAEKTDLEWRATKVGVGADPAAEIEFVIVLVKN